jgi:hypothetical protein
MTRIQRAALLKRLREDEWHDPWYKEFRTNYLKDKKKRRLCAPGEEKSREEDTKEK